MYLQDIYITRIQPCTADTEKIKFRAKFPIDISEILPYINATMKNATYNHNVPSLTFKKEIKVITLYRDKMAVAKAISETDAHEITDFVKQLINNTYLEKDHIEPLYEMREKPTAIEIYQYLPKINCKKCGEVTCLAFASKFLMGGQSIKHCRPLYEDVNKEKLEKIETFAQTLGYQ